MILRAEKLAMRYMRRTGQANYFYAVRDASLQLRPGEVTVLMGRSGSGKTTLLHMLSGLLTPTGGRVLLGEMDLYTLGDRALSRLRNEKIAVVPQGRSAIDSLTVLENVLLPGAMVGIEDQKTARHWLEVLGIEPLADTRPAELSGGELRRMAIARALARNPAVLLADEPTGDLDDASTRQVLDVLGDAARDRGAAVLIVSHDSEAASCADAMARLGGGVLTVMGESIK